MPRRKTSKKNTKENKKKAFALDFGGRQSETRFKISLIFLIAALVISVFIFLFTMIGVQNREVALRSLPVSANGATTNPGYSTSSLLKDSNLEFTLKIPPQLGQWLYKTGFVKSPIDETLSNRYAIVYVPQNTRTKTNNIDDLTQNILTIRQFSKKEWEKLESGCQKGNQFYCEVAGTKIGEKDQTVYTYTKPASCPKDMKAKCSLAEKIIKTFTLK